MAPSWLTASRVEMGRRLAPEEVTEATRKHAEAYARLLPDVRPLPGARELLAALTVAGVPWAIATSGRRKSAGPTLTLLDLPATATVVSRR